MSWDPSQYLLFADQRRRPGVELLARIGAANPALIYDLGCGAGNLTRLLAERWPQAKLIGLDSSAAMLEKAQRSMGAGAAGLIFGRNVWQRGHDQSLAFVARLQEVLAKYSH